MKPVRDLLAENPVLVLFVVVAVGAAVGRVRWRGFSLGPAGALFAGLALSALDERVALPEIVGSFGLALFAYAVGLSGGREFVLGLRRHARSLLVSIVLLVGVLGLVQGAGKVAGLPPALRAGLFAGVTTNTPALAVARERVGTNGPDPTVGYSIAYPFGVIGMLVAAQLVLRATRGRAPRPRTTAWTVRVGRADLGPLGALRHWDGRAVSFGRYVPHTDAMARLATDDAQLAPGDLLTVVGAEPDVAAFCAWAGVRHDQDVMLDRSKLDVRRMTLSSRHLAGATLADLALGDEFGATVTRVRRGDIDLAVDDGFVLQLGDRLRVVAPTAQLEAVARLVGDSERALSEFDAVGLAGGITVGVLIGLLGVPVPGLGTIHLGAGGGALIAGMVAGVVGRSGPVTWQLPLSVNVTLRQLGTLVFLAAVGTRAGQPLLTALHGTQGLRLVATALVVVTVLAVVAPIAYRLASGARGPLAAGLLAGLQTQPAVLAAAWETSQGDPDVGVGYAVVFPVAMIAKILLVQLLVA